MDRSTPKKHKMRGILIVGVLLCSTLLLVFFYASRDFWHLIFVRNIPIEDAIPWGVWESKDPPIMLFIDPDVRFGLPFTFPAIYSVNDKDIKLFVDFSSVRSMIGTYRAHLMRIFCINDSIPEWGSLGDGFQVVNDRLTVTIGGMGICKELNFYRIENYPLIRIENWPETPWSVSNCGV